MSEVNTTGVGCQRRPRAVVGDVVVRHKEDIAGGGGVGGGWTWKKYASVASNLGPDPGGGGALVRYTPSQRARAQLGRVVFAVCFASHHPPSRAGVHRAPLPTPPVVFVSDGHEGGRHTRSRNQIMGTCGG